MTTSKQSARLALGMVAMLSSHVASAQESADRKTWHATFLKAIEVYRKIAAEAPEPQ